MVWTGCHLNLNIYQCKNLLQQYIKMQEVIAPTEKKKKKDLSYYKKRKIIFRR